MKIRKITWAYYIKCCYCLSNLLKEKTNDKSIIITMPRGGYIPSSIVSYVLGINKIFSYGYSSYQNKTKVGKNIYQDLSSCNLSKCNVFLIDDIIDTSHTVDDAKKHILSKDADINLFVASVFVKKNSLSAADFYVKVLNSNEWLEFPYDE